jgi:glucan phosphorylase
MGAKYAIFASHRPPSKGMPLNTKHLPTESGALIDAHLLHTIGVDPAQASQSDLMLAVSQMARTQLSERWVETQAEERKHKARRVVYLSMEFLMGAPCPTRWVHWN